MGEKLLRSGTETVRSFDGLLEGLIRSYAEMGMFTGEIRQALSIEHEISPFPSPWYISSVLNKTRRRGELQNFTPEEKGDIIGDQKSQLKRQELDQRVLRWLFTKAILTVHNESLEQSFVLPQGRLGWKDAIKKLEEDGMLDDIISHTKPLILRHMPLTDAVKIYKNRPTGAMSQQEKSFLFVRKCLEEGLIGEDLSSWHDVHALYELHSRSFTKDSSQRIRLEVWFRARNTTEDMQLVLKYKELGGAIDSGWFDKSLSWEEDFIANASSINKGGYGEDPQGSFRVGSEGKLRTPIGLDDGQIIFDNFSSRAQRAVSRDKIALEAKPNKGLYSSQ